MTLYQTRKTPFSRRTQWMHRPKIRLFSAIHHGDAGCAREGLAAVLRDRQTAEGVKLDLGHFLEGHVIHPDLVADAQDVSEDLSVVVERAGLAQREDGLCGDGQDMARIRCRDVHEADPADALAVAKRAVDPDGLVVHEKRLRTKE